MTAAEMFCGHCGDPLSVGDHAGCVRHLELEPPRYCTSCARRMKVQVTPRGWSATCVEHGVLTWAAGTTTRGLPDPQEGMTARIL